MAPLVTYLVEPWEQYYADPARPGLWLAHYAEFKPVHRELLAFGPDVASYAALAKSGALVCVVARSAGQMIGYCLVVVKRHMHYAAICGFEDTYYLAQEHRRGLVGYELLLTALAECKRRGTVREYWQTKDFLDMSRLFERLGARHEGSVFVTDRGP